MKAGKHHEYDGGKDDSKRNEVLIIVLRADFIMARRTKEIIGIRVFSTNSAGSIGMGVFLSQVFQAFVLIL